MKNPYLQTYEESTRNALNQMSKGYLKAMARMGVDELSQALKAFPESIGPQQEVGAPFEPTPQEIFQEQGGYLELQQQRMEATQKEIER